MFLFKRKKRETDKEEIVSKNENIEVEELEEDELTELDALDDDDTTDADKLYGEDNGEDDEEDELEDAQELNYEDLPDVAKKVTSLDMLAEFITSKAVGAIQYLNKQTHEAFELREYHFRIAKIWGSVSMAHEYSPVDFAKIALAMEVIEENDKFLVLPSLTESECKQAIIDFCEQKYSENGKKYVSNTQKFAKLVKENNDMEEWRSFNKELVFDKLVDFCDDNNIVFEDSEVDSENE